MIAERGEAKHSLAEAKRREAIRCAAPGTPPHDTLLYVPLPLRCPIPTFCAILSSIFYRDSFLNT